MARKVTLKFGEREMDRSLFVEMRKNGLDPKDLISYTVCRKVGEPTIITVEMYEKPDAPAETDQE